MFIHYCEKELNFYDKLTNKSLNLFFEDYCIIVSMDGTETNIIIRITVVTIEIPEARISTIVVVASAIEPRVRGEKTPKIFFIA